MTDLLFDEVDGGCIVALPEKTTPIVGKSSVYKYRTLAYSKGENVVDFTFLHPVLYSPGGIRFKENCGSIMFLLPLNDENLHELIYKYEEYYRACSKFADITSPLMLDESRTAYRLYVKVNKNTVTDENGNLIDWNRYNNRQLWLKPKIQWERIPLNTIKNLQLKLVSAEIIDSKPIKKKDITMIRLDQYDQGTINELQRQLQALASK